MDIIKTDAKYCAAYMERFYRGNYEVKKNENLLLFDNNN